MRRESTKREAFRQLGIGSNYDSMSAWETFRYLVPIRSHGRFWPADPGSGLNNRAKPDGCCADC